MKVLISGNGYAGSLLGYFLAKKGIEVVIVDPAKDSTSTKVSAGIMIPLTGRRIVKTWNADTIIPFATETYKEIEAISGKSFFRNKEVLQIFNSAGNMNDWFVSSEDSSINKYIKELFKQDEIHTSIKNNFGGIVLKQSGAVDPVNFLNAIKEVNTSRIQYIKSQINPDDVLIGESDLKWNGNNYDYLIFCEGHHISNNKWFGYVPFKPAKGEILDFSSNELDDRYIINGQVFILPLGNGNFRAGSTYNWNDLSDIPTVEARQTLEDGIRNSINSNFEITNHKAGIRPAIIDRRPIIGFHPEHKRLGVFNGLGTKGAMIAPFYANQFSEEITSAKPHEREVSIRRFDSLYPMP